MGLGSNGASEWHQVIQSLPRVGGLVVPMLTSYTKLLGGNKPLLSCVYMCQHNCNWRRWSMQSMVCARALPLLNAGRSRLARIAMMPMTTSNSIRVNPVRREAGGRDNAVVEPERRSLRWPATAFI